MENKISKIAEALVLLTLAKTPDDEGLTWEGIEILDVLVLTGADLKGMTPVAKKVQIARAEMDSGKTTELTEILRLYEQALKKMPDEKIAELHYVAMRALMRFPPYFKVLHENGLLSDILNTRFRRKTHPRKWTPEAEGFVQRNYPYHYQEIKKAKAARNLYVEQKHSARTIRKLISTAHPHMPSKILDQILLENAPGSAEIAREWTALELKNKYPKIDVQQNTLKARLYSKTDTNADTNPTNRVS